MRDPLELFVELTGSLARGRLPARDVRAWFVEGAVRAVARDERLDHGLRLSNGGHRRLQARVSKLARDMHLAAAARGIVLDPDAPAYAVARRLADEIEAFIAKDWPSARYLPSPPRDWSPWRAHLFHAARTDQALPTDVRHLQRLLADPAAFSTQSQTAEDLHHLLQLTDATPPDDLWPDRA